MEQRRGVNLMPETVTTAFCMDYKRIDFLFCDDGDTYNIMEQVRQLQGTGGENPVLFHTPGEEEMAMPFSVTGGAHYEVGDKYFTRRSQLDSYQLILTCSATARWRPAATGMTAPRVPCC